MLRTKTFISIVNDSLDETINTNIEDIETNGGIVKNIDIKIYDSTSEKVLVTIIYVPSINIYIPGVEMEEEAVIDKYTEEDLEETYPNVHWDILNPAISVNAAQ